MIKVNIKYLLHHAIYSMIIYHRIYTNIVTLRFLFQRKEIFEKIVRFTELLENEKS